MTTDAIYKWLIEIDPVEDNVKRVWTDMASYCYFINSMDFDQLYTNKLEQILKKSIKFNIIVPNQNRSQVIKLAEYIKASSNDDVNICINKLLYDYAI